MYYLVDLYHHCLQNCETILSVFNRTSKSNIDVIRIVIKPKIDNEPAFFTYHTDLKSDWQIALLSNLITLTPGTIVLGISDDRTKIYTQYRFHYKEEEVDSIKSSLEKWSER